MKNDEKEKLTLVCPSCKKFELKKKKTHFIVQPVKIFINLKKIFQYL